MAGPGTADQPVQKVFICYRREETAAHAGRLYDAMVARFGERNVFMDVDIAPGVDFVERITEVVSGCLVLIVVMGPGWATVADEDGNPRIADPDDFVRVEVETALRRTDVTPIPVLVAGARMPKREDLPPELQTITRRNALELSDARWGYDVGRLNTTLDDLLGETSAVATPVRKPDTKSPVEERQKAWNLPAGRLLLEGMLVAGATAFAARWLASSIPEGGGTAGEIGGVILRRGGTWAATGAAFALWLAIRTRRPDPIRLAMWGLFVGAVAGAVGGVIWAVPALLPDPDPSLAVKNRIEVGSLAVTGGFLGALIGALWRPPRLGPGLAVGIAAGVLVRLIVNSLGSDDPGDFETALDFAIAGIAIAASTLATLLALDRRQPVAKPAPYLPAADP